MKIIITLKYLFWFNLFLLTSSCSNLSVINNRSNNQFEFSSLDLQQTDNDGDRTWDIKSPEARYDNSRGIIRSLTNTGIIYTNNNPDLYFRSDQSTIVNDGEIFLLEGNVVFNKLDDQNSTIKGDIVRWNNKKKILVIDSNPKGVINNSKITSEKAILNNNNDQLYFKGNTNITRSSETIDKRNISITSISFLNGYWNLETGSIYADGPVSAYQTLLNDQDNKNIMTGKSVSGNFKYGNIDINDCFFKNRSRSTTSEKCSLLSKRYFNNIKTKLDTITDPSTKRFSYIFSENESTSREKLIFSSSNKRVKTILEILN